MSARDDIQNWIAANWTITPFYALDDYVSLDALPPTEPGENVLVIDYPSAAEELVSIAARNVSGWREQGFLQLALLCPLGGNPTIARAQATAFRDMLRAKRYGATVVLSVDTFSSAGFEDGRWQVFSATASYYHDAFYEGV